MTEEQISDLVKQQLPYRDGNRKVLKLGIFATLYFEHGHTLDQKEAVLSCVNEFLEKYGNHVSWGLLGEGRPKRIAKFDTGATSNYLKSCNEGAWDDWQIDWHSDDFRQASDVGIDIFGQSKKESELHGQLSYLSVHFPIHSLEELIDEFPRMIKEWAEKLSAVHGYGGLGIVKATDRFVAVQYQQIEYAIAQRFNALEVDYPLSHSLWTKKGIKGGNWLTILSIPWVEKLGGVEQIVKKLGAGFSVESNHDIILIRAGKSPILADSNKNEDTPIYRKLAKVLKPIRISTHPSIHSPPGKFNKIEFEAWLNRFD